MQQRIIQRSAALCTLVLVVLLFVQLAVCGCDGAEQEAPAATEAARVEDSTAVTIPGELEAADAAWVAPRTLAWGRHWDVIEKIVSEGTEVEEGDFLFQMELTPRKREADAKEVKVKGEQAKLAAAESKVATLEVQLDAEKQKTEARATPYRLAVTNLKSLPDPVELSHAEAEVARLKAIRSAAESHYAAVAALAEREVASKRALAEADFERRIAAADLILAEAGLDRVKAGADPYDVQVAELEEQKARGETQLDIAELSAQVAEAEADVQSAKTLLMRAEGDFGRARKDIELGTCHAPKDGVVAYEKVSWSEEKVGPGVEVSITERVLSIISGKSFRFRGRASEALLGRIRSGLPARVRLEALQDTVLEGHVEGFDVALTEEKKDSMSLEELECPRPKTFEVLVALDEVPEGLMPGLSGKAEIEVGPPGEAASDAPRSPASGVSARAARPLLPCFAGYVDAIEKTAVFVGTAVNGRVTSIVEPYASVGKGDAILECTADRLYSNVIMAEREPEFCAAQVEKARLRAAADKQRRQAHTEQARLEARIAELRLEQLQSLPNELDVKMAEAKVRKAELELARAQLLFDTARASGLESESELESKELDVRLAELGLEEVRIELEAVRNGAPSESLDRAQLQLAQARERLADQDELAWHSQELQEGLIAHTDALLEVQLDRVAFAREQYERRFVRAPAAGNVVFATIGSVIRRRRIQLGDTLPLGSLCVAHVADLTKLRFCIAVEEPYAPQIKVGDEARVELLALRRHPLKGTVSSVMPLIVDREEIWNPDGEVPRFSRVRGARVDVLLELPEGEDLRILPGMTGTATLLEAPGEPRQELAAKGIDRSEG